MIRRVVALFGSLRVTLVLILSLAVNFLLGLWIPQKGLLQRDLYLQWKSASPAVVSFLETLGLTNIHTSPLTIALWALFFMNLLLVMGQRAAVIRKKIAVPEQNGEATGSTDGWSHHAALPLAGMPSADAALEALKKRGYRIHGGPGRYSAVKNRLSPLATLLFHFSFFLILLGGVVGMYTKFSGTVDIAEGEAFRGEQDRYQAYPRLPRVGTFPDIAFTVERIELQMPGGAATHIRVTFIDDAGKRGVAEVNRPYRQGRTIFVIKTVGVAPLCVLRDSTGRELDGAYVKLDVFGDKQDSFNLNGLIFDVRFFPDHVVRDGNDTTRSRELRNPVFVLNAQKGKRFIARARARPGETVVLGGYRFTIPELRYWVRLDVVNERGEGVVYAGFAVAVIALVWRLVFYRREFRGTVILEEGRPVLLLAGRAEFYKDLFGDEFEQVKEQIRSHA